MTFTIGGQVVTAQAGTVTSTPAGIPHALDADERARMLLIMLHEPGVEPCSPQAEATAVRRCSARSSAAGSEEPLAVARRHSTAHVRGLT